ncbi:MAG: hypothetical protein AAF826_01590 [Pseudomonadota bacterium]
MIASLPMYARPQLEGPIHRFWALIQEALSDSGINAPAELDQNIAGVDAWLRPDLLLSQTCGAPFRDHLHGKVQLVGTPDARIPGCPPGYYQSVFIARDLITWGDAISGPWAANEPGSQSGTYAARLRAPSPLTDPVWSGSHLTSIDMVSTGQVDWASIDAVTWDIATQLGTTEGLIVWDRSEPTPALPYITALTTEAKLIRYAVKAAIKQLAPQDQRALCVYDLVDIPADDYLAVPKP